MKRLLLILLFLPALSFADDYMYWDFGSGIYYQDLGSAKQAFESKHPCTTGHDGFVSCEYIYSERNGPSSINACLYRTYQNGKGSNNCPVVISKRPGSCPGDQVFDFTLQQCTSEPEPDQCEAGNIIDSWAPAFKDSSGFYFADAPSAVCVSGCQYTNIYNSGHSGCKLSGDVESGVIQCAVSYNSTGSECTPGEGGSAGSGDDGFDPEAPEPEGERDPNCRRYTDSEGRHLYDCSPKEDPDENNSCPPGYMMQGSTCFRIPPDHPDYDPDKDPQKPDEGDGGNVDTGDGSGEGDGLKGVAQEKTLKSIDQTVKGIDSSIKTGNATTHSLLQGIKDAIDNIPGGGGGPRPGTGNGDGDGDGGSSELTAPEEGSFEEAIASENEEIAEIQEAINAKFAEIKAFQVPGLTLSGGGGSLPVVALNFARFGTHQLDFNEFEQPLIMMGQIFVFICGLLALFIMFVRT